MLSLPAKSIFDSKNTKFDKVYLPKAKLDTLVERSTHSVSQNNFATSLREPSSKPLMWTACNKDFVLKV